jgi:cystathionine beta-synthase
VDKEKRLLEPQDNYGRPDVETKGKYAPREMIAVRSDDLVSAGLAKMNEMSLSQVPVIDDGNRYGSLRESHLLAKVFNERELLDSTVSKLMEKSFPVGRRG